MKYISFTFDDGRGDNYTYAYPIMRKYNIAGTVYCTTSYLDGTLQKTAAWRSSERPLSISDAMQMQQNGWEIALHGNQHTTEANDLYTAAQKLTSWKLASLPIGFSIPNSSANPEELQTIIKKYLGNTISHIRTGRRINTKGLLPRILFGLYTFFKIQWAYNAFNKPNLNKPGQINLSSIYSVVIRHKDDEKMIIKFIDQMLDDTWVVFMLHTILPDTHSLYKIDPWTWSSAKLEKLCNALAQRRQTQPILIAPVQQVLEKTYKTHSTEGIQR